ncbi:phage major capsid protein [Enterococcus faecalis]|uniref:phage major capsid protein n=1 Tax=Enterococcus faecalis TaxID=1351 RepID=UPI001F057E9E|nr:phage major capsid protein [Enterococcus faecalis]MCH1677394.1 phage major capsid protein [Enterococcus faecalis]MCH1680186.1 phage major capsid protein [Enterococcus faecalis]
MSRQELMEQAQTLLSEGKLDEAEKVMQQIKALDEEKPKEEEEERAVDNKDEEKPKDGPKAEEAKDEPKEEPKEKPKDEPKAEEAKDEPKEEPKAEEKAKDEPKKEKRSLEQKGEENMEKVILEGQEVENKEVRGFLEYLRSKETRALPESFEGVKSADASAVIPEEIITKAKMLPESVVDLRNMITRQKVTHAMGKYPILKANDAVLATVAELEKNPDLEKPAFEEVKYEVETYRGQIAVAEEALQDSDDDLSGIIARHIQRQGLNTANKAIVAKLQTATPVAAKSIDDLKTQVNTGFDPAYNLEFIVSQSFFNVLDQMKDNNGRYLLEDDIKAQSGKSLLGRKVTVLADKLIGTKDGDKVAFLGQPDAFAVFFDRVDTTVRWVEHQYYGQVLAVAMRFDCEVVDKNAGKYITLTPAP